MGRDNGAQLSQISKEASAITNSASALAKAINNKVYKMNDFYRIAQNLVEYIEEQQARNKPLTVAGLILASGVPTSTWYDIKNGEMDSITALYTMEHPQQVDADGVPFYVDADGQELPLIKPSEICKNAYLYLQNQLETNCYTNKGNPAGSIFGLKAQFNWSDDTSPQRVTNNLVIATEDGARRSLALLFDK